MRNRQLLSRILVVCLLLQGCGVDSENTDPFQTQNQIKDSVAASVSEDIADKEDESKLTGNAVSGNGTEQTENVIADEDESGLAAANTNDILPLQKDSAGLAKLVQEQAEALEGYAAFLEEYEPQRKGEQEPRFALLFLDGDEVPELIVMEGWPHAQSASVYLFQDGEVIAGEGKESPRDTDYVNGKEVTEEQYQKASYWWAADEYQMIEYDHFRVLPKTDIRKELQEELEERILMREDVLKQNLLLAAGAQENDVLLLEYDDYDGDGKYEAFMIVGKSVTYAGGWGEETSYKGTLYFAGADGFVLELDDSYGIYRMIDGKMDFGSRKYLFFYTEYAFTSNVTELWTVRDGKPVDESKLIGPYQLIYRGENEKNEFEVLIDSYSHYYEKKDSDEEEEMRWGHVWKPHFWYYDSEIDQIKKYEGKSISKEAFAKLSGTDIIEEIEAEGYTIGEIIHWKNDIVTINYHKVELWGEDESEEIYVYENVIWDNRVKDYWRKDERGVTSWENAGKGGSYGLP